MIEQTISKRKEQQEQQQQTPPSDIETKAAVESKIVWIQKDNEKISLKKKKEDQERQLLQ